MIGVTVQLLSTMSRNEKPKRGNDEKEMKLGISHGVGNVAMNFSCLVRPSLKNASSYCSKVRLLLERDVKLDMERFIAFFNRLAQLSFFLPELGLSWLELGVGEDLDSSLRDLL